MFYFHKTNLRNLLADFDCAPDFNSNSCESQNWHWIIEWIDHFGPKNRLFSFLLDHAQHLPVVVLLLEEPLDLVEAVPVDGLHVLRREPHGDDALVDVREVCRGLVH